MKKRVQISKVIAGLLEILAGLIGFIGGFYYSIVDYTCLNYGGAVGSIGTINLTTKVANDQTLRVIALFVFIFGLYCLGKGITDLKSLCITP